MVEEKIEMETFLFLVDKKQLIITYLTYKPIFRGIILILGISIILFFIYYIFSNLFSIFGIFATGVITLSLLMIKEGVDSHNLENKIFFSFIRELGVNILTLRRNIKMLQRYLRSIDGNINYDNLMIRDINYRNLNPIYRMNFEFWDSIKVNIGNINFIKDSPLIESIMYRTNQNKQDIDLVNSFNLMSLPPKVYIDYYKKSAPNLIKNFEENYIFIKDVLETMNILVIHDLGSMADLEEYLKTTSKNLPNFVIEDKDSYDTLLKTEKTLIFI